MQHDKTIKDRFLSFFDMMPKVEKIPSKPSELVLFALKKLEEVEKDDRYVIDMDHFHMPNPLLGKCYVCLGGMVVIATGHTHKSSIDYDRLKISGYNQMLALNSFQLGDLQTGLNYLGIEEKLPRLQVRQYKDDPDGFKADMKVVVEVLRNAGH